MNGVMNGVDGLGRPRLLILSFSNIRGDARVLKQVVRFTGHYDVITCGMGAAPEGVVEHIRVPDGLSRSNTDVGLIVLRQYRRAYRGISAVAWARKELRGRQFDVVIANDVEAVPIALELKPRAGVLADLHEYAPRQHDQIWKWRLLIRPFLSWLCRRYVSQAASWSTVSAGIVAEYERQFGFRPQLVTNATPFHDLVPGQVRDPIRLVHSGGAMRARALDVIIDAVLTTTANVTLDLYLTPNDPAFLDEIKTQIAGSSRVTLHDPVPYSDLIETINAYDVGIHMLPPVNFNHRYALPNKLFDYVQARLGIVIGPSAEMERYVERYDLGVVAQDFTVAGLRAALETLTPETVTRYKAASHRAATELGSEPQVDVWQRMIEAQLEASR